MDDSSTYLSQAKTAWKSKLAFRESRMFRHRSDNSVILPKYSSKSPLRVTRRNSKSPLKTLNKSHYTSNSKSPLRTLNNTTLNKSTIDTFHTKAKTPSKQTRMKISRDSLNNSLVKLGFTHSSVEEAKTVSLSQQKLNKARAQIEGIERKTVLSTAELCLLFYGKKMPNIHIYSDKLDLREKTRELLSYKPSIILKMLNNKPISEEEVKSFFGIEHIGFSWSDKLEQTYKECMRNKQSYISLLLKNVFFMVKIGLNKEFKRLIERNNGLTRQVKRSKVIDAVKQYETISKTSVKQIRAIFPKINSFYLKKNEILSGLIVEERTKYLKEANFSKTIEYKREEMVLNRVFQAETSNLKKEKKQKLKDRLVIDKYLKKSGIKGKKIKIRRKSPSSLSVEGMKNYCFKTKMKNFSQIYLKELVKSYKKAFKANNFDWKVFLRGGSSQKSVIVYFAEKIKGLLRMNYFRKKHKKEKIMVERVINCFRMYLGAKKSIFCFIERHKKGEKNKEFIENLKKSYGNLLIRLSEDEFWFVKVFVKRYCKEIMEKKEIRLGFLLEMFSKIAF